MREAETEKQGNKETQNHLEQREQHKQTVGLTIVHANGDLSGGVVELGDVCKLQNKRIIEETNKPMHTRIQTKTQNHLTCVCCCLLTSNEVHSGTTDGGQVSLVSGVEDCQVLSGVGECLAHDGLVHFETIGECGQIPHEINGDLHAGNGTILLVHDHTIGDHLSAKLTKSKKKEEEEKKVSTKRANKY